eukprot:g2747.t1
MAMQASVLDDVAMKRMAAYNRELRNSNSKLSSIHKREAAKPSARSWGQMVRNYKADAVSLPWQPSDYEPFNVVTRYQMSRDERDYDPVAGRFNDRDRERQYKREERATELLRSQIGKERQLSYTQTFDIINHKSKVPKRSMNKPGMQVTRKPMPDTRSTYNILTNKGPLPEGMGNDSEHQTLHDPNEVPFNIVSNKFHVDHERKMALEADASRTLAAERFWKSRNYDPVKGTYYDNQKEAEYWQAVRDSEKVQGQAQAAKLPRSVQYAEGSLYNPITQSARNTARLREVTAIGDRGLNAIKRTAVERDIRTRSDAFDAKMESRVMNRISHARAEERRCHGYDVVTCANFPRDEVKAALSTTSAFDRTGMLTRTGTGRGGGSARPGASNSGTSMAGPAPLLPATHSSRRSGAGVGARQSAGSARGRVATGRTTGRSSMGSTARSLTARSVTARSAPGGAPPVPPLKLPAEKPATGIDD